MSYYTTKNCFEENLRLFCNPRNAPEKYNLYNGLANFTKAIQEDIEDIKQKIQYLQNEVHSIK